MYPSPHLSTSAQKWGLFYGEKDTKWGDPSHPNLKKKTNWSPPLSPPRECFSTLTWRMHIVLWGLWKHALSQSIGCWFTGDPGCSFILSNSETSLILAVKPHNRNIKATNACPSSKLIPSKERPHYYNTPLRYAISNLSGGTRVVPLCWQHGTDKPRLFSLCSANHDTMSYKIWQWSGRAKFFSP